MFNNVNFLYPKNDKEAISFRKMAKQEQDKIIQTNTDKIILNIHDNIYAAINRGQTWVWFCEEDWDNIYGSLFDPQKIKEYFKKWAQYKGFHLEIEKVEYICYRLSWSFKDLN